MILQRLCPQLFLVVAILVVTRPGFAQIFSEPPRGWAYTFDGGAAKASDDLFGSLDGNWDHINASDRWDGSAIGEGSPGGVSALSEMGDDFRPTVDFIRVQDPGDPRDYDLEDPSNRGLYFTHSLVLDELPRTGPHNLDSIVSDGVTLYFRTRLATERTGPLDSLHPDGGDGIEDWPVDGIGYSQHNGGKSIFAIKEKNGANVAFGLDYGREVNQDLFTENGLILQHRLQGTDLAGQGVSGGEDSDPKKNADDVRVNVRGNIVPLEDLTTWQDFWITIQAGSIDSTGEGDLDGTHLVTVYHGIDDFSYVKETFHITAATSADYRDDQPEESYIAIGAGATGAAGAFDVDQFSWAPGIFTPQLFLVPNECGLGQLIPGDLNSDGEVGFIDFLTLSVNFGEWVNGHDKGDVDCNGRVDFGDFLQLSGNFGAKVDFAEQQVPEPPAGHLMLASLIFLLRFRHKHDAA